MSGLNPGARVRMRSAPAMTGTVDGWIGPSHVRIAWDSGHRGEEIASALEVCPSEACIRCGGDGSEPPCPRCADSTDDHDCGVGGRCTRCNGTKVEPRPNEARRKLVDAVAGVRATDREEIARATVRAVVADLRQTVEIMRRNADDMRRQNHGGEIEVYDRADALERAAEYIESEALERVVGAASTDTATPEKETNG